MIIVLLLAGTAVIGGLLAFFKSYPSKLGFAGLVGLIASIILLCALQLLGLVP